MATATHKVTFFFEGRGRGWTESLHYASPDDDYMRTTADANKLAVLRANLLGKECWIKAIRVSKEGTGPDAELTYVRYEPKGLKVGVNGNEILKRGAAQPDVGLLLRCENAAHTQHKFLYLRGIWDEVENNHGEYTPTADWLAVLVPYFDEVKGGNWGWWGVAVKAKQPLDDVARQANDQAVITTTVDLVPPEMVGKVTAVRISGVNAGRSNLNTTHVVRVMDRKTFKTTRVLAVANTVVDGSVAWWGKGYIDIANIKSQKIVTRECGAPLLESPGRQKARPRG